MTIANGATLARDDTLERLLAVADRPKGRPLQDRSEDRPLRSGRQRRLMQVPCCARDYSAQLKLAVPRDR